MVLLVYMVHYVVKARLPSAFFVFLGLHHKAEKVHPLHHIHRTDTKAEKADAPKLHQKRAKTAP